MAVQIFNMFKLGTTLLRKVCDFEPKQQKTTTIRSGFYH